MNVILDREITYTNPSSREFRKKLEKYGYSKSFLRIALILYFTVRLGKGDAIYDDLESVLGRKARK
ncbi:MAG: hypothetical protein GF311_21040 [Candidatus Lokiarchaeota archaeon]|nr:hypothetical protein [Candidatus Lokiarchaeota archaeon]